MITAYKVIIVIVVVIVIGLLAYMAFSPVIPNCDPTIVSYTQVDNITGAAPDGTQCYCPTDYIDSDGKPQATWIQQNSTQFYACIYA